jgi:hypothetical protein
MPEFVRLDEDGVPFNMHTDITVGIGFTKMSRYHLINGLFTGNGTGSQGDHWLKRDSKKLELSTKCLSLATNMRHRSS